MANQTINIPVGKTAPVQIQVLDAANNDITSQCTITFNASSQNVALAKAGLGLGAYSAAGVTPSGGNTATWTATNTGGSINEADTINVTQAPPATINVVYGTPQ